MTYSRILLKLSGEVLMGGEGFGIDADIVREISSQIRDIADLGIEIAIVVGGGNIYRGGKAEKQGVDRVTGDYMGMIATLINALALQEALEKMHVPTRVQSALEMRGIVEPYAQRKALEHLEKDRVVIFACGTGNPFFTTDTAAALRALEVEAQVIFKATRVDGVYDKDPEVYEDALFFKEITYSDVLNKGLKVMDATAITICRENNLPIIVFNIKKKDNLKKVVLGENIGTIVKGVL
ncbi:MAG: UMP kinase [Proteobacteria bacterium]|nr:UMP kinase [Pseudomonadota bacterium]